MEPVVYEESPLADYLKDDGGESEPEWAQMVEEASGRRSSSESSDGSPPASPSPFAPTGRPSVQHKFRRNHVPNALQLDTTAPYTLHTLKKRCSAVIAARIDRADNAKFLEQFRYTIVASQLLSDRSFLGQHRPQNPNAIGSTGPNSNHTQGLLVSTQGLVGTIFGALAISFLLRWVLSAQPPQVTRRRIAFVVIVGAALVFLAQLYLQRQWVQYRREQALIEITSFVTRSHDIDGAVGAALGLIQEVELVSRGYRLSTPLPPISRIEDRSQGRKCVRIRKTLKRTSSELLDKYRQVLHVVKGFSEPLDLEKYYDIYDINDFDIEDAFVELNETGDEQESLRTLKLIVARFHVVRKLFLCALLALEANGEGQDLVRWTAAVESLSNLNSSTEKAYLRMKTLLTEEESFPVPETPKMPLTPNRERWRSQLRKLDSFSTGVRGLQAKLQLLREESDRTLDASQNLTELGPSLMAQYEAIGLDLKELVGVWEEGKAALAQGIDRNEKRLSSMSTLLSPTNSLSGLTTVEETGSAEDALKALTGGADGASAADSDHSEEPQEFEAIALPRTRPRSTLSREERISKMREERELKTQVRQQAEATRGMLKELETVINLRPRAPTSQKLNGRITSL